MKSRGLDDSSLGLIYVTGREGWDGEGTGTASIVDDDGRWEKGAGRGRKGKGEMAVFFCCPGLSLGHYTRSNDFRRVKLLLETALMTSVRS